MLPVLRQEWLGVLAETNSHPVSRSCPEDPDPS
jgi:hypothetical protein